MLLLLNSARESSIAALDNSSETPNRVRRFQGCSFMTVGKVVVGNYD